MSINKYANFLKLKVYENLLKCYISSYWSFVNIVKSETSCNNENNFYRVYLHKGYEAKNFILEWVCHWCSLSPNLMSENGHKYVPRVVIYFSNCSLRHRCLLSPNQPVAALSIFQQLSWKVFLPWSLVLFIQSKVQVWLALCNIFIKTFKIPPIEFFINCDISNHQGVSILKRNSVVKPSARRIVF